MRVWIGYECYFNGCDEWRSAVKVFDDEVKALVWKEEVEGTHDEWRDYQEFDVE
jgi:hypothetical protein